MVPIHTVATDITTGQSKTPTLDVRPDPRVDKLTKFFKHYNCPPINYALTTKYLERSDSDGIKYSLLPSISVAESSCGKRYINNNIYGWGSARIRFGSIEEGLTFVSHQLGSGKYYANKTTDQKLRAYNPSPQYRVRVEKLMKELENE